MHLIKWTERSFFFGYTVSHFPLFIEKLKCVAPRIEEIVNGVTDEILSERNNDHWSIKEHIGHLIDLEELGEGRIIDFRQGLEVLRAADMENKKTYAANHNARPAPELIAEFRISRQQFIKNLLNTNETTRTHIALHPRLKQQITLIDLLYFITEHDNQHIAIMAMALAEKGINK